MKVTEALEMMTTEGLRVTRRVWKEARWVELRCPRECPDGDGPLDVFEFRKAGRPISDVFELEADAKKALADVRKEHTRAWTKFTKDTAAWLEASQEEQNSGQVKAGEKPGKPKDYYDDVEIIGKQATRLYRLNSPYFVAMQMSGEVTPWLPTTEDLLATDWSQA